MGESIQPADHDRDRRYSRRKAADIPLFFRILHLGKRIAEMRLSTVAEGRIRDLGPEGIGLETSHIIVDGMPIARVTAAHPPQRLFLQCELPGGIQIRATAKTVWCEQVTIGGERSFQLGLRFCELSPADRAALDTFLHPPSTIP